MSRLIILCRPTLVPGFQLAGVQAYGAEDVESAEERLRGLLDAGKVGLLAIDDGLLAEMDPRLVERLSDSDHLYHLAIPGGRALGEEYTRRHHIAEMLRRAIGFSIAFEEEEEPST
jgi:vacuolar-type H+-ATPase subunit F/Vma7